MTIAILNGPNLNKLGTRKPDIYGSRTMAQILIDIQQQWPDIRFLYRQTNHEGVLIDWLQELSEVRFQPSDLCGIVLNAGGYSHTSVALRDAVEDCEIPVVEVHISDISRREPFRANSLLTDVCAYSIKGIGTQCYAEGVKWLLLTQNKTQ